MSARWIGVYFILMGTAFAQTDSNAGNWKTWVISSGRDHGVPAPPGAKQTRQELQHLRELAETQTSGTAEQIRFWDSGPPSYRWMELLAKRQSAGQAIGAFPRAYAYVSMAIYDATIAAWEAKYSYDRDRPSKVDRKLTPSVPVPKSPSYPSDYAATAAAAANVLAYLVPSDAAYFLDRPSKPASPESTQASNTHQTTTRDSNSGSV